MKNKKASSEKAEVHPSVRLLNEDLKDKELQKRYDNFKVRLCSLDKEYEELATDYNKRLELYNSINECIIHTLKLGFSVTEHLEKSTQQQTFLVKQQEIISKIKIAVNEERENINGLKQSSEHRFFSHYKQHKAHGITDKGWFDWYAPYKEIII